MGDLRFLAECVSIPEISWDIQKTPDTGVVDDMVAVIEVKCIGEGVKIYNECNKCEKDEYAPIS